MSDWLTVDEAARQFRITPATLRHWIRRGFIESERQGRRLLIIDPESLRTFVEAGGPAIGWPKGVKHCPRCWGADVLGHECPRKEN
jgi:excisionase family DNA binding protein